MKKVHYDEMFGIEAYALENYPKSFPLHFHDYYMVGVLLEGKRSLYCGKTQTLEKGDLNLFNPYQPHSCQSIENQSITYHALNISKEMMAHAVKEITGKNELPYFSQVILRNDGLGELVEELYQAIRLKKSSLYREELIFLLIEHLLTYTAEGYQKEAVQNGGLEAVCHYLHQHYTADIRLTDLVALTHLKKSSFIHQFTKNYGMTPYRYLLSIRITEAKKLLANQQSVAEVALMTHFSDQSHFSNVFKSFIGLTPKQYQRMYQRSIE
jgi:AraC-like DNA-binding protein